MPTLRAGESTLDEAATRYVVRTHRLRRGATFVAFDPEAATEADAQLLDESPRGARCRFDSVRPASRSTPLRVTLLQAFAKGTKLDRVVRDATVLGASELVVVSTERTIAGAPAGDGGRAERWRKIAVEAARQCGRGDMLRLSGPTKLRDALAGELPPRRLLLDPEAEATLHAMLADWAPSDAVALLVGPEGGLSEDERDAAKAAGFAPAALGPFVLRTETAAAAALAVLASRVSVV